ncbi:phage terminase large subunit [Bordetella hinzii]|uniref:N-acetyltransferase YedL n=1 Tax=Bordetella hinzii OH87 BAL007II TaxID=1331262 RepID=A0ABR4R5Q5_9BORD|nr:phage terminase large subunit [Bordetella hinzii]KCB26304.1 hypothetical protein L544_3240 [Bordetella hinzii OH87 BAL007II]
MRLHAKQLEAQAVLAGDATHLMLFGGSRSGKTFLLVRNVVMRAMKAPKSRHAILRFRFAHVKNSVIFDTFPKVMELAFKGVRFKLDKTNWYVEFENGSQIWFGGLDDKERTEKILGMEFVTIYLNESSQIPWSSVGIAVTRLAQKVEQQVQGGTQGLLKPRMYYDCNPPSKAHWSYQLFILKRDPETKIPLTNPQDYASFRINPQDNAENLSDGYLDTLKNLSAKLRKRFLDGEFADATPNQLFKEEDIDRWRCESGQELPDMVRVVVAVDPSGSGDVDNVDNDAIGIVVTGLGTDGNAYVLEDCTVKAGPATWGKVATDAYERHDADIVVGESNFGGAMVEHVIRTARPRTPFKMVSASRGKVVRAEPFSALYEQGKVRHVGRFHDLEDELAAFSTVGYLGQGSPNRADSLVWSLAELFPALTKKKREPAPLPKPRVPMTGRMAAGNWM